jgi:outer membrane protein assembly factor BamB
MGLPVYLMPYDRLLNPSSSELIVAFSDTDRLSAFDTSSGRELWSFVTDAPVRLPPAGTPDSVCFVSDDGFLYCVAVATGQLRLEISGSPGTAKSSAISATPTRRSGGVVIRDGVVFSSTLADQASTSPPSKFLPDWLLWINDSTGSTWIKQPHSAPSFAGVAPRQAALVATGDSLIVPGGRSVPAVFNRSTGIQLL